MQLKFKVSQSVWALFLTRQVDTLSFNLHVLFSVFLLKRELNSDGQTECVEPCSDNELNACDFNETIEENQNSDPVDQESERLQESNATTDANPKVVFDEVCRAPE